MDLVKTLFFLTVLFALQSLEFWEYACGLVNKTLQLQVWTTQGKCVLIQLLVK